MKTEDELDAEIAQMFDEVKEVRVETVDGKPRVTEETAGSGGACMSSDINVRDPESRRRIALQCVDLLRPSATPEQRTRIANRILAMCDYKVVCIEEGQLKEITDDRLLDAVCEILQVNRTLLKDGHLEHEDHDSYFRQQLAILKKLGQVNRDNMAEPGGIVQSPDGKLWCIIGVDDDKIVLRRVDDEGVLLGKLRGGERIEVKWAEWVRGWQLRFP